MNSWLFVEQPTQTSSSIQQCLFVVIIRFKPTHKHLNFDYLIDNNEKKNEVILLVFLIFTHRSQLFTCCLSSFLFPFDHSMCM